MTTKTRRLVTLLAVPAFLLLAGSAALAESQVSTPKLSINIPTVKFSDAAGSNGSIGIAWLPEYIVGLYNYGLTVGGVLAAVMMMWGGFQWLMGKPAEGKTKLVNAAAGLVVLLSAYIILSVVNPNLTALSSISVQTVARQMLTPFADDGSHVADIVGVKSTGNSCFFTTYGSTDAEVGKGIIDVRFAGSDQAIKLHAAAAPAFDAAFREWETAASTSAAGQYLQKLKAMPFYKANCVGGSMFGGAYVARLDSAKKKAEAAGKDFHASYDLHRFGAAVDIDSCNNPFRVGTRATVTTVPDEVISIFAKHGIYWGGYGWVSSGTDPNAAIKRDGMHWEYHGKCWQ